MKAEGQRGAYRLSVLALIAVMAVVIGVAGCGSSKHPSADSPTSAAPASSTTPGAGSTIDGPETSKLPTVPSAETPPSLPNPSSATGQQQFVTTVFNDTQAMWQSAFRQAGVRYTPAKLVLFTSGVETGCGAQSSDVGPFYCPSDATVYLDLRFFSDLLTRLGVSGDFSQAYVIAHEMGHHIQSLLGISSRVAQADARNPSGANALSVRVELQADCLAGVWAHTTYTRNLLEPGDLQSALSAAAAVGDDFLSQIQGNAVQPETWTHGSSAQRQQWLTTGYQTGDPADCNTFS